MKTVRGATMINIIPVSAKRFKIGKRIFFSAGFSETGDPAEIKAKIKELVRQYRAGATFAAIKRNFQIGDYRKLLHACRVPIRSKGGRQASHPRRMTEEAMIDVTPIQQKRTKG